MLHRIILTPGVPGNLTKNLVFKHSSKNFSTISVFYHSHSHSDGNSHSHSHGSANVTPNLSNASTESKTEALLNQLEGHGGHSHSHDDKAMSPGKKFLHSHSHPEYPELDEMDLSGEDYEFTLNEKKKTVWTTIKDFFNPHTPIHQIMNSGEAGHSHGHSHSHSSDPEALKLYSKNLANEGVKITWIGLGVNASMAVSKFFGGIYFHSQALVADAVHSVGDLVSDVLTLSTVKYSTKPPSDLYPFGYGKIETLGSLFVSAILLVAGLKIGWASLVDILSTVLPHNVMDMLTTYFPAHSHTHVHIATDAHSHDHSSGVADAASFQSADINAAWIALASIGVKEWLFRATRKVGEKMDSKVLIANAWHHRVDSLTSVVALATITTGYFLNIYWLDSIGGLIVSLLVMKVGVSGVVQSLKELIDKALPKEDPRYTEIEDLVNVSLMKEDSNLLIRDLNILSSGTNLNVNVKLGVGSYNKTYENQLTLNKMGDIGKNLEAQLKKDYAAVKNVGIQFVSNDKPEVKEEAKEEAKEEVKEEVKEDKKVDEVKEEEKK